jgi:DNA-binding MarR family transcriptional regulator
MMAAILEHPARTWLELAEFAHLEPSLATSTLRDLKRRKLVEASGKESDSRYTRRWFATDAGRAAFAAVDPETRE